MYGSEIGVGDDLVDETDPQRRVGVDEVARQRHLPGPRRADATGQVDEHRAGEHADAQVGVGEAGPFGGDDEVAGQRELEPAGDGRAVDRGDHRDRATRPRRP